jgi:hypothetical protein
MQEAAGVIYQPCLAVEIQRVITATYLAAIELAFAG